MLTIRSLSFIMLLLTCLISTQLVAADKGGSDKWLVNFEEAKALAKKTGKPILADFTGSDWCGYCIKLKGEVFDTAEFKKFASENVILLELDFPRKKAQSEEEKKQNRALAEKYGIRGYPTILLLDADGKQIGKSGYKKGGPKPWIEDLVSQYKSAK